MSTISTITPTSVLSPDHLKNWSRCRKKYFFQYVQKLSWPSDTRRFDLGQDVHKLMEYQARGFDLDALVAGARPDVRACFEKLMAHPASQWPVVASEWGFMIPLRDARLNPGHRLDNETLPVQWLTGRIDRVAYTPQTDTDPGTLWIIDWKTGTAAPKFPEKDWQTRVYRYAVVEAYDDLRCHPPGAVFSPASFLPATIRPEQVKFLYLEVKGDDSAPSARELVVPYDTATHESTRALLTDVLADISVITASGDFHLPDKCPDRYCPYRLICGI